MTSIASVSQTELSQRRQKLRRQRRVKSFQAIWRTLAVTGLAGGLFWVTTLPAWVIRKPEQIVIEGNRLLSSQAIRAQLPLSYPQYLLRLQPQVIAQKLELEAPIADATVTRQLLPPSLTISVKERLPVAIAQSPASADRKKSSGLIDAQGVWMPLESYTASQVAPDSLPSLKVIGMSDQYRLYWPELYRAVSHSPVKVAEIDWQDPANLILKTEQGIVHFGPYGSRFAYQLRVLDQMRELPAHLNANQIAYIDLKNPDSPAIQMVKPKEPTKKETP